MNNKPIDRTKKSNIKCEHCKFWCEWSYYGKNKQFYCKNLKSEHCDKQRNYWNRCKQFEWAESEESDDIEALLEHLWNATVEDMSHD